MDRWDEIVTDRSLNLEAVLGFVECRQAVRHTAALPLSEPVHHPVRRMTGPRILHRSFTPVADGKRLQGLDSSRHTCTAESRGTRTLARDMVKKALSCWWFR